MSLMRSLLLSALLATTAAIPTTNAARIHRLAAVHHDGQTFLTWSCPPGVGWRYRVYVYDQPMVWLSDFWSARYVGMVGDSTWCDRRLTSITGTTFGYSVDTASAALDSTQALFVVTPPDAGTRFYCVTAESCGRGEDRSMAIGDNSLLAGVDEQPGTPLPVYQRTMTWGGIPADIFTLFASPASTAAFPAMSNRFGYAFDCALVRGAPGAALMVRMHPRGGDFMQCLAGSGVTGEWRLALDDPWMNLDGNSFWFGWHENYDPATPVNDVPVTGVVRDYTLQRVLYTLMWARRGFAVDTTRVYSYGYSMGGIGSIFLALRRPDLFAGVLSIIGKMDFSFTTDPNPANSFNTNGPLRAIIDRMWGAVSSNLPTPSGTPVYSEMDGDLLVKQHATDGLTPIIAFNGRNDWVVGWAEKIPFFRAMSGFRQGGYFFWDPSDHASSVWTWSPMVDPKYLYRFRTNRSYPALSQCTADYRPGYGDWISGDSIGTINGFVEWDSSIVDNDQTWECKLTLRDLNNRLGVFRAPDSLMVNATPRRVQHFAFEPLGLYRWTTIRVADGAILKTGIEQADSSGVVTFYWIKVHKWDGGTILHVERVLDITGVPGTLTRGGIALSLSRNPASGPVRLQIEWPAAAAARVELFDVLGRRARTLLAGPVHAGPAALTLDPRGLGDGVYFVVARQREGVATRRLVLVH